MKAKQLAGELERKNKEIETLKKRGCQWEELIRYSEKTWTTKKNGKIILWQDEKTQQKVKLSVMKKMLQNQKL